MLFVQRDVDNKSHEELKYLGFVKIAAIKAFVCVSNLYEYAKQNSGPLRSAVRTAEDTVTTVLGPVYNKSNGLPNMFSFLWTIRFLSPFYFSFGCDFS